jgi:hypothetical protein
LFGGKEFPHPLPSPAEGGDLTPLSLWERG